MGMVQAISMGQRDNNLDAMKLIDPGQALSALTNTGGAIRSRVSPDRGGGRVSMLPAATGRATPGGIWGTAATKTLTEHEERLKKEAADLAQERVRLNNEKVQLENAKLRGEEARVAEKQDLEMGAARDKAIQTRFESGMKNAEAWRSADVARQQAEYDMGMKSMLLGDAKPFLNYMRTYGNRDQNLQNIEVSPNGKEFMVTIDGQPKPILMNKERFEAFVGAVNPKVLESISNIATKEAATATKNRELGQKDLENYSRERDRLAKEWASDMRNAQKPEAEKEAWINKRLDEGGVKRPGKGLEGAGATQPQGQAGAWQSVGTDKNTKPKEYPNAQWSEKYGAWLVQGAGETQKGEPAIKTEKPKQDKSGLAKVPVAGSWTPEHIDAITREYFRRYQENGGAAAMQYREGIEASQRVTGAAGKENLDRLEKALSEVRPQVASGKSYDQIKTQEAEEAPSGYEPGPSTGAIQNEKPLPRDATKELKQGEEKKKATNESRAKETATATYVDENGDTVKVVVGTDGSVTKKIVSKKQEQTEGGGESEGDGGGNED